MLHHLEKNQVPAFLRGGYNGKAFKAQACTSFTIPADAGLWSGGSRDAYSAVSLADGRIATIPGQDSAPWNSIRADRIVEIKPGFCLIRHSMFCGKDMGLTFFVHPDDIVKLVPHDSCELVECEKTVLYITCAYKSFARADEARRMGIDTGELESIKARLIKLELLAKNGAITVKGRNAISGYRPK
jgi:hypothetical protein